MSAFGGKADIIWSRSDVRFVPEADIRASRFLLCNLIPESHVAGPKSLNRVAETALAFMRRKKQSNLSGNLVHGCFIGDAAKCRASH